MALKPSSHAALYNWGVALSDLARAIKGADPREATAALHLASQKYAQSLQLHPRNPQALNNWGLVLQVSTQTMESMHMHTQDSWRCQGDCHTAQPGCVVHVLDNVPGWGGRIAGMLLHLVSAMYIVL